jgi:Leucine Rich repeat
MCMCVCVCVCVYVYFLLVDPIMHAFTPITHAFTPSRTHARTHSLHITHTLSVTQTHSVVSLTLPTLSVSALYLHGCVFSVLLRVCSPAGIILIAKALRRNTVLTYIDLSYNDITDKGVFPLCVCVCVCVTLLSINVMRITSSPLLLLSSPFAYAHVLHVFRMCHSMCVCVCVCVYVSYHRCSSALGNVEHKRCSSQSRLARKQRDFQPGMRICICVCMRLCPHVGVCVCVCVCFVLVYVVVFLLCF